MRHLSRPYARNFPVCDAAGSSKRAILEASARNARSGACAICQPSNQKPSWSKDGPESSQTGNFLAECPRFLCTASQIGNFSADKLPVWCLGSQTGAFPVGRTPPVAWRSKPGEEEESFGAVPCFLRAAHPSARCGLRLRMPSRGALEEEHSYNQVIGISIQQITKYGNFE